MEKSPIQIKNLILGKDISLFEYIEQAISFCGVCQIMICTYSISEDGIRFIQMLKDEQIVSEVSVILDNSCLKNKIDSINYLSSLANVYFTDNHAKFILLKGKREHLSIITSSNFNTIKRTELIKLEYNQVIFNELLSCFESTIQKSYHYE